MFTFIYIYVCVCVCVCMYVYVCVCVCVCVCVYAFLMAQQVKNPAAIQETQKMQAQFLGWEDSWGTAW